jgi:hypothetical protein
MQTSVNKYIQITLLTELKMQVNTNNELHTPVFPEKFMSAQLFKKLPDFIEQKGSLPCSLKPAARLYSEHTESTLPIHPLVLENPF